MSAPPPALPRLPAWACRLLAAGLILAAAGLHVAYLAHDCPLDLSPDEAHYWDWSRHLDWSYYSKGPLIAYLIRAGCEAAGAWSESHTASLAFAVRLPAVACGSLLLASLYVLTVQVYRRETLALGVVALALTTPVIAAGSSIMTIDSPYTCCWGWALVFGYFAAVRGASWAWPAAGAAVGLGVLAKYTMVLWLPSAGLFLLADPERRRLLVRPGFWVMTAVAGILSLPILIWNMRNGWVTFHHVANLTGDHLHWTGPLNYLSGQVALLLGFLFAAWAAAMVRYNPAVESDPGVCYLWWTSAPMFLVFFAFSIKDGGGEVNWPVTAYLSGMVLAAAWLARQLASRLVWHRRTVLALLVVACGLGLALAVVMHHTNWVRPVLAWASGPATAQQPMPLRRFDPTCRLRGFRTALAPAVDRARERLRAENGEDPVPGRVQLVAARRAGRLLRRPPPGVLAGLGHGGRPP
jgi:4-amino-4-deoxy-L-arabinose transferase-like glycosyltransferase